MSWKKRWLSAMVMICAASSSCGPPVGQPETQKESPAPVARRIEAAKKGLEQAIALELAELEISIGELRSKADATDEDFTSEFVHLDQLMSDLDARLEKATVANEADLERLRFETERALEQVKEAYDAVETRVVGTEANQATTSLTTE